MKNISLILIELIFLSHHYVICWNTHFLNNPLQVTTKPWPLWKTFLVCLLACLIATTLVVLVLYFVHSAKPTSSTTIIIHADGKSSHVTCIPGSTPSPAASTQHESLSILPSAPVTSQSPSTKMSPSALVTMKAATWDHEIIIEDKKWHVWALSPPQADQHPYPEGGTSKVLPPPCQELPKLWLYEILLLLFSHLLDTHR